VPTRQRVETGGAAYVRVDAGAELMESCAKTMTTAEQDLVESLQQALLERVGERVGTFKVAGVDNELSMARQAARAGLTADQRGMVLSASETTRAWLIARDPEAAERVASGGPAMAPQDIGIAVRAAEDFATAEVLAESIDRTMAGDLQRRWRLIEIETMEQRIAATQPDWVWTDLRVKLMALGILFVVIGLVFGAFAGLVYPVLPGAVLFGFAFRSWKLNTTRANVGGSSIKVNSGGSFGRSKD
jgi:hypothetical protein